MPFPGYLQDYPTIFQPLNQKQGEVLESVLVDRVEKMHQDKHVEWLKSDNINSFQDLRAVLAIKLSNDYPEIQIQQQSCGFV